MAYILAISVRSLYFGGPGLWNGTSGNVSRVSTVYPTCIETKLYSVKETWFESEEKLITRINQIQGKPLLARIIHMF